MIIVAAVIISLTIFFHAVFSEISQDRTRKQLDANHKELIQLGSLSIDSEIKNAYEIGYQTAMADNKRMDN